MKHAYLSVALPALCLLVLLPSRATAQGTTHIVAADGRASSSSCEAANPVPRKIQTAIDRSVSGDRILVCPGVYEEQLKIVAKDLTIRGVTSGALGRVLIKPVGVIANSTNAFSGAPVAAVVAVEEASDVILRNLTIDGADNRLADCSLVLVGIFYRNASGEVQATVVRDMRFGATFEDCSSGFGIFAQSGGGGASKLTVSDSSIHGYHKVGIVANEVGTKLHAVSTSVTGSGAAATVAQNGIQIGFGATGRITDNSVVNHVYTCATFPCDAATNILIFESSQVNVARNKTAKALVGILLVQSDNSEVRNNWVSDTDVFDGIAVVGNNNHVYLNQIVNSDEFAVSIEGDHNLVEGNTINDAACGIFSSGTRNRLRDNVSFNTDLVTCAPFTLLRQSPSLDARSASRFSSSPGLGAASDVVPQGSPGVLLRAPKPAR